MVGEIRDLETAEIAIQAALTGHLVFSTLHTNDAPGAITRLQDMGVEPYLVCLGARRRAGPAAGAPHLPGLPGAATIPTRPTCCAHRGRPTRPAPSCFRGKGCDDCRGTGLSRAHRHLRAVPDHRGRAQPDPAQGADRRDPAPRGGARHGHAPRGRLGQGAARASRRWRRSCASRRRTPSAWPSSPTGPRTGAGQTIDGVMEAPDARGVVERLQRDAYFPIQVTPQERAPVGLRRSRCRPLGRRAGSRAGDLVAFTQQLATLLEAGLPLDRALGIHEELAPNARAAHHHRRRAARASAAAPRSPRPSPSTTRAPSRGSTSTWCGPARRAACSKPRSSGSPSSSRRRRRSATRSSPR